MKTDTLIVGGGISGLHTAYQLQKQNRNFILVEARESLGGRILSNNYLSSDPNNNNYDFNEPAFDLGPSWFWPSQSRIQKLINELGLEDSVFHQHASGQSLYEDQQGNVQQGFFGISMEGTYRLNGGMQQLTASLANRINDKSIFESTKVESIEYRDDQILTRVKSSSSSFEINSEYLVFALPPRLVVSSIEFKPELSESRLNELTSYATWMAGHAKIIATYSNPFWLENELSGDAVSHIGPMREIHDASSDSKNDNKKSGYALFGFVGIPGSYRKGNEEEVKKTAVDQLVRLFGEDAANPTEVYLKDWAQEEFTATEIDQTTSGGHANSSIRNYAESDFDDRVIWSGTETADHLRGYNGLIEGALEASKRTVEILMNQIETPKSRGVSF